MKIEIYNYQIELEDNRVRIIQSSPCGNDQETVVSLDQLGLFIKHLEKVLKASEPKDK